MAFTSPGLVLASNKAIIEAQRGIAFAKNFATDFSAELQGIGKTVAVPVFSGTATVYSETGTVNNFETTDGSIIPVNVTLDTLVKVTFKLGMNDLLEIDKSSASRNCGIAGGRAIPSALNPQLTALNPQLTALNPPARPGAGRAASLEGPAGMVLVEPPHAESVPRHRLRPTLVLMAMSYHIETILDVRRNAHQQPLHPPCVGAKNSV